MSAEKKLYNLEVNPPAQVWEKLSSALDELHTENLLKKKLTGIQSNPPANTWQEIESILDKENAEKVIAEKLINISEVPPAGFWNNIDAQLAEEDFDKKFAGLGKLEVTPPAGSWTNIAAGLDREAKIIPMQKSSKKFIRYVAAAIIIGLFAWGGISLVSNKGTAEETIAQEQPDTAPFTNTPAQNNNEVVESKNDPVEIQVAKGNSEKEILAVANKPKTKRPNNLLAANFIRRPDGSESIHTGSEEIIADINALQKNKTTELGIAAANPDTPRYLVYLNEEGELVKVSKKLADMKCLYNKNGEISQDALASINRKVCDDIVKSWQEKLSKAPINLSFNPLEMADILK